MVMFSMAFQSKLLNHFADFTFWMPGETHVTPRDPRDVTEIRQRIPMESIENTEAQ